MSHRILAIEDNQDNMKLFQWALEDEGYEFSAAGSAEEGLEMMEQQVFDLIVMDISLPGMDGITATCLLRSDPRFRDLPIVAATAHAIKEEEIAIRDCGVSALVTKPIDEELFLDTIRDLLAKVT